MIDGEPLRAGVFALRKILDCAVQIANGLAAAHDAGIVHRDLKPENILLTRDGQIKILDFGLAKMNATRMASAATETLTVHTEPGVVMGTVGYMSPEQVRGKEVDHRSDIFSFGVFLYELLSGRRAFQGETSVETMTAILKQELPDLPETVPPGIRQMVHHCLDKDPANRFQSARDLSFALTAVSQGPGQSGGAPNLPERPRWRRRFLMAAARSGRWRSPSPLSGCWWPRRSPRTGRDRFWADRKSPSDPVPRPTANCLPSTLWTKAIHRSPL